ncbi:phosphate transport system substrate-binding protein [Microbulbifer donghaiensis]|uniref:Phosphate transport system substrate-binding protein n=1 Tax=Microbulbifer donghaiensis TaxID=494016 RepID=A0A1M4Y7X7_9GAMM|nr:phosphate ABC transporter substrate-binding protein [Microbulbifer donghaiensis]SHF01914.1 phosphate transport system substrate-binding protein [Microbulbifer donghaiensis]
MGGLSMRAMVAALLCCQLLMTPALAADKKTLFRLTGSNTIGAELAPRLVKGYLHSLDASDIQQRSEGERHWITANLGARAVEVPIVALGSSTGFKALDGDSADIGMASRKIKQKEVDMLTRFGNLAGAEAEHVIGLDALVIAIHPSNPVGQLTIAQLRQIYSGEISNWAELGGADLPIRPLHRDIESGTRATFDEEVFGGSRPTRGIYEVSGNAETHQLVLRQPGAIGYLPFADAGDVKKVAIKSAGLAAVVPDRGIIATEDFPLTRRLYLYKNPSQFKPHVDSFLHFVESPEGQKLVAETGFINLTPVALKMSPYPNAPEAYRQLMEQGERLSISFRFANGSSELDSRALKDLRRLEHYMDNAERELNLILVGFSDQKSNSNIADIISRFRALKVQGALLREHQLGDSKILALGAFAPLTVDSEQAPIKNSRVEVWIN